MGVHIQSKRNGKAVALTSQGRERWLLSIGFLFVFLNRLTLLLVRGESWNRLWSVGSLLLIILVLHVALNQIIPNRDPYILPITLTLAGWGITLVARLAPAFAIRQVIWVIVSSVACLATVNIHPDLRLLRRYRYTWLFAGLILLAATLIFGVNPSGNPFAPRLWLGFWRVYFQPSEILKLLLVVFLASYLADRREILIDEHQRLGRLRIPSLGYTGPMLLMWGFCMILLVWQRDLGAASLFFLVFLSLLYVSTGHRSYLVIGVALLVVSALTGYILFDVVRLRVDTWWNPWPEADNRAFQIVQSLLAVSAGGVFGKGVGLGYPTFIPVVHSDFVYAAIAEEWGLFGSIGVLLCIAFLVTRGISIAMNNLDRPFHALLATGISSTIAIQSLMIMGGVLKVIPLTGVTLPFVSYGGSSLLSSFIMVGLLLRMSDDSLSSLNWRRISERFP